MRTLCFVMYQFEVGGCENVFTEVSKTLATPIELVTSIPHLNEALIQKLPKNVKVIRHQSIPILSLLSKIEWSEKFMIIYSLISMIVIPIYLKKRNKRKNVTYINFSDTLSSLVITIKTAGKEAISWLQCRPSALEGSKSFRLYLKYLKKCKKIVFICNSQKKEFIEKYNGFNTSNFIVVYNPIDTERILKLKTENIDVHTPYICMVSRIDERSKDFHTPIDAYAQLPEEIKSIYSLIIIGDGPDKAKIHKLIINKKLEDKIFLLGADSNPYKWMSKSELFLFSSKNEGLGLVILEAMVCGKIVIATDCPVGPSEILKSSKDCGILVPVGDSKSMAEAIKRVIYNQIPKDKYLLNAQKRLNDFSISNFRNKLTNLFNIDIN